MDNKINLLITLTDGTQLLRVAIKITPDMLEGDVISYYLEPENKAQIAKLLPEHCKSGGYNIVEVQEIFEIKDLVLSTSIQEAEQETLKRVEEMRDAPPPYSADKENPMKHIYQNQGYARALDDVLRQRD